mmetsp:Transcript_20350/g.28059  ORF Transcript_20350/g.28059 Transcript_20350/m.28059 type:complete len:1304 (+) Transcript_20350:496-4407(+)
MLTDVREVILSKWPHAKIHQFGSHPVGLSVFLSDLDVSILGMGVNDDVEEQPSNGTAESAVVLSSGTSSAGNGTSSNSNLQNTAGSEAAKKSDWVADFGDPDDDEILAEEEQKEEEVLSPRQLSAQDDDGSDEQQSSPSDSDEEVDVDDDCDAGEEEENAVSDVDGGGEVSWFVDVTGNPLEVALDGEAFETLQPSTTSESSEQQLDSVLQQPPANKKKRKRLIDDSYQTLPESHHVLKHPPSGIEEAEQESGGLDIVIQDDSDDEVVFQAHLPAAFKPIKLQSDSEAVKVQLEEDLVVQYFDQNSLCVATSSAKRQRPNRRPRSVEVVDLVSDSEPDSSNTVARTPAAVKRSVDPIAVTQSVLEEKHTEMDFSNVFNADSMALPGSGGRRFLSSNEFQELTADESTRKHRKQRNLLRDLLTHLKFMDWVQAVDFRCKAKVPIINFLHKNGLQCDLSIGVTAQDTSEVVQRLKDSCGPSFAPLTAVLKILLLQHNLDKPYTGGLGSYKLYFMVAFHLVHHKKPQSSSENQLGLHLLTFLKFFGSPRNLNKYTELTLPFLADTVSFQQTFQVEKVQALFERCHGILHRICKERIQVRDGELSEPSCGGYSFSALGCIIDAQQLSSERMEYLSRAGKYPLLSEEQREAVGCEVLALLVKRADRMIPIDLDRVRKLNPRLAARFRSFTCAAEALQPRRGVFRSLPVDETGSNHMNSNKRRKLDPAIPANKYPNAALNTYSLQSNGVVGLQIAASMQSSGQKPPPKPLVSQKKTARAQRRTEKAMLQYNEDMQQHKIARHNNSSASTPLANDNLNKMTWTAKNNNSLEPDGLKAIKAAKLQELSELKQKLLELNKSKKNASKSKDAPPVDVQSNDSSGSPRAAFTVDTAKLKEKLSVMQNNKNSKPSNTSGSSKNNGNGTAITNNGSSGIVNNTSATSSNNTINSGESNHPSTPIVDNNAINSDDRQQFRKRFVIHTANTTSITIPISAATKSEAVSAVTPSQKNSKKSISIAAHSGIQEVTNNNRSNKSSKKSNSSSSNYSTNSGGSQDGAVTITYADISISSSPTSSSSSSSSSSQHLTNIANANIHTPTSSGVEVRKPGSSSSNSNPGLGRQVVKVNNNGDAGSVTQSEPIKLKPYNNKHFNNYNNSYRKGGSYQGETGSNNSSNSGSNNHNYSNNSNNSFRKPGSNQGDAASNNSSNNSNGHNNPYRKGGNYQGDNRSGNNGNNYHNNPYRKGGSYQSDNGSNNSSNHHNNFNHHKQITITSGVEGRKVSRTLPHAEVTNQIHSTIQQLNYNINSKAKSRPQN